MIAIASLRKLSIPRPFWVRPVHNVKIQNIWHGINSDCEFTAQLDRKTKFLYSLKIILKARIRNGIKLYIIRHDEQL